MNAAKFFTLSTALAAAGMLQAQNPADPLIEPVSPPPPAVPVSPAAPESPPIVPTPPPASVPAVDTATAAATPVPQATPLEQLQQQSTGSEGGFVMKDTSLNVIFQFLAKKAGRQYFHNAKISGPDFNVTGHLNEGNPLQQMEELAFQYGLSLHTKGNTVYALTQAQLGQLPSQEFHYQLRYLRPTDIEQIKELIKPMLSPGTGIVNFEPKTSTVIIVDSAHRIEQAREFLHGIDKVKGQIVVETKILRVNSTAAERTGVNWSGDLGVNGQNISLARDLNSIFGLADQLGTFATGANTNLVLTPVQLTGVLRALNEGGLASQISNPTLITEDNEQSSISIIDRVPIITSTTTPGTGGSPTTFTEEVRYKIDTSDKSIDADPEKHREIGISLVVTPTLLPDGTIRMKMRPRSAQIVEQIESVRTGNFYPRVTESMVETLARVPDGNSLVVGGFYGEIKKGGKTKVPVLGDVPVLNFFFKSKEATKENTSLVFIVTPKSYNPTSRSAVNNANANVRSKVDLDCDHDWVDKDNPGPGHEPNLKRTVRGMQPNQAPYYPRAEEIAEPRFSRSRK